MSHCWLDTEICGHRQGLESCLSCHRWPFSGALYCNIRTVEKGHERSPATYVMHICLSPRNTAHEKVSLLKLSCQVSVALF